MESYTSFPSFSNFLTNLQSGWMTFFVVFAISFSFIYMGLAKFFTKGGENVLKPMEGGKYLKQTKTKTYVENKNFIILISAGIAFLIASSAIQTGFFLVMNNSYGFVLSAGIILAIYTILLIPIYKFIDKNIGNRIFTNIIVFGLFWVSSLLMFITANKSEGIPVAWMLVLKIIVGEFIFVLGIILAIILGVLFKKTK